MRERRRGKADRRYGGDRRLTAGSLAPAHQVLAGNQSLVHFLFRLALIVAILAYFNIAGVGTLPVAGKIPLNALLLAYVIIIAVIFRYRRQLDGNHSWQAFVPIALDLILITAIVVTDMRNQGLSPFFLLYLLSALSFGLQYGALFFRYSIIGGTVLGVMVLTLGILVSTDTLRFSDLFFLLVIVIVGIGLDVLFRSGFLHPLQAGKAATIDQLTGLLNRQALFEAADNVFRHARKAQEPLTVAVAGLDRFTQIDKKFGATTGDKVLSNVARLLKQTVRDTDVIARFGDAKFVFIFPESSLESSDSIVGRIQNEVSRLSDKMEIGVSMTVGLGDPAELGYDLGSILKRLSEVFASQGEGQRRSIHVISQSS